MAPKKSISKSILYLQKKVEIQDTRYMVKKCIKIQIQDTSEKKYLIQDTRYVSCIANTYRKYLYLKYYPTLLNSNLTQYSDKIFIESHLNWN